MQICYFSQKQLEARFMNIPPMLAKPRVITWFFKQLSPHDIHFPPLSMSVPENPLAPLKVIEFLIIFEVISFISHSAWLCSCCGCRNIDFIKQTRLVPRLVVTEKGEEIQLSYQMKEEYKRRILSNTIISTHPHI